MEIKYYDKLLVSKFSPENRCNVEDGAILIVTPKRLKKNTGYVGHYFVDHIDQKTKSQYGWVKTVAPMSLNDFINKYLQSTQDSDTIFHNKVMLDSIQNLSVDTPVAATYSERGIEQKRMEFTVHKVFFR
ncbi:MAG: hypothetical protein QY309_12995 [Cyclobacteriaceae bacterium]|nr:MAG: hypothetical protein QY309_12995 [Cyclobacteriaceae bacterium]